jgi:hypothetical protein
MTSKNLDLIQTYYKGRDNLASKILRSGQPEAMSYHDCRAGETWPRLATFN